MKENQDKRERALRKMQEEIALQDERKDMLLKLDNRMRHYQKIQTMMVKKIKEYRLYEVYVFKFKLKFNLNCVFYAGLLDESCKSGIRL